MSPGHVWSLEELASDEKLTINKRWKNHPGNGGKKRLISDPLNSNNGWIKQLSSWFTVFIPTAKLWLICDKIPGILMGFPGILPVPRYGPRTTPRTWVHPNPRRKNHRWVDILKLKKRIPKYLQTWLTCQDLKIESKYLSRLQVVFCKLGNFQTYKNGNFSGSKKCSTWFPSKLDNSREIHFSRSKGTSRRHDTMMLEQCFEVTFWFWNSRQIIHQLAFTIPRCAKLSGESCANG